MSHPDALLHQLAGQSRTQFLSQTKIQPVTSSPKVDHGHRNNGGDRDELNGVLEDSGYESPPSKPEEEQEQLPLQVSAFEETLHARTSSAPMPRLRPSRIPISTSTTKIGLKRSVHNYNWSPVNKPSAAEYLRLVQARIPLATVGDQGPPEACQDCTEENFLRLTQSGGQFGTVAPPSSAPAPSSQGLLSKSVSSMRNSGVTKTDFQMKMQTPRFIRSRSATAPFPSPCLSTGQFPSTPVVNQMPSYHTMLRESESFQAIKTMVDKNVHEILQEGEKEFGGKYSEWIQQVFNLQLEKIHGRLRQTYTQKLRESLEGKEKQVLEMKTTYRSKLLEFEEATKKFQNWYDEVIQVNQSQLAANRLLTSQLQEQEVTLRRQFEVDMESKLIQLESSFERERQQDLSRHADQLKQITDKGEAQKKLLVDRYQHQVDTLKTQLESYKNQNAALKEKYTEQLEAKAQPDINQNNLEDELNDPEREQLIGQIRALETEVEELQLKNETMAQEHSEEVIKLQKTLELNNQKIRVLIEETREESEEIRAERARGIRDMQVKIRVKENEHRRQLSQLTERYGKKIEELTNSVQLLQSQFVNY